MNISRFAVRDRKVSISSINVVAVSVMFVVYSSPGMASRGYEKKVLPPREGRGEECRGHNPAGLVGEGGPAVAVGVRALRERDGVPAGGAELFGVVVGEVD